MATDTSETTRTSATGGPRLEDGTQQPRFRPRRPARLLAAVLAALALAAWGAGTAGAAAPACAGGPDDVFWRSPVPGYWHQGANWSTDSPPGPAQNACLLFPAITVIHQQGTSTIKGLRSQSTLSISGGTLSVGADSEVTGLLELTGGGLAGDGGTLTGPGELVVKGQFNWLGGRQSGTGATTIAPGATLSIQGSAEKDLATRTLNNAGLITWSGSSILEARGSTEGPAPAINNLPGATFEMLGGPGQLLPDPLGHGLILRSVTFPGSVHAVLTNSAGARIIKRVGVVESSANISTRVINHGLIEIHGGQLGLGVNSNGPVDASPDGVISSGTIAMSPDAALVLNAHTTLLPGAAIVGGGDMSFGYRLNTPPAPQMITANLRTYNQGTLIIGGPTGIGSVTVNGNYGHGSQFSDSFGGLSIDIGGSPGCTAFDRLQVTGTAELSEPGESSRVTVSQLDGCDPSPGQQFTILQAGSVVGTFVGEFGVAPEFMLTYTPTSAILTGT